jgi:hypothetical protein
MPLIWSSDTVKAMAPARFGGGIRLEMFMQGRDLKPGLSLVGGGTCERFPATPAGWVDAWTRAAALAGPEAYAKGLA